MIDIGSREFRDPKVFWYAPAKEWRMVAVIANEHKVLIWRSADLKQWTRLSEFGPRNATGGLWECPDLFPLAVDGDRRNVKWVMLVSLNPGGIAGGSGTQYFVGDFDGTTFTADGPATYEPPAGTLLQGFESGYAGWTPTGTAFGTEPVAGALPGTADRHRLRGRAARQQLRRLRRRPGRADVARASRSTSATSTSSSAAAATRRSRARPRATRVARCSPTSRRSTRPPTCRAGGAPPGTSSATARPARACPYHQGDKVLDTCVVPDKCDPAVGTFVSPEFTVTRDYVNLLIAGGTHPLGTSGPTVVELVSGGQVVGSVTGNNSGEMDWRHIDARAAVGEQARIVVRDDHSGGDWGHLMVDDIRFSDTAAGPRDTQTTVNLVVDGEVVRSSTGSDSEALDWASWDLADLQGRTAQITVVDHSSGGWGHILADQFMLASAPAKSGTDRAAWVDYGRDNYAGVTFNGLPDDQRTTLSWMSNWQYAGDVPTDPWRGQMTMPRTLSLVSSHDGPRLRQVPVAGVRKALVNRDKEQAKVRPVAEGERPTRARRHGGPGRGAGGTGHGIRGRPRGAPQCRRLGGHQDRRPS